MNNKQLQIVTFNQAKRLKSAGFDWVCDNFFLLDGNFCSNNPAGNWGYLDHNSCGRFSAPTSALALKWLRDVKGMVFEVSCYTGRMDVIYSCVVHKPINHTRHKHTYEEAESALLDELLKILDDENN